MINESKLERFYLGVLVMSPCVRRSRQFVMISLFLNFCSLEVIITVVTTRLKKVIGRMPRYLKRCHCLPFATLISTN